MGKKIVSISLLLLWMLVIFFFSAQPAEESAKLSQTVKEKVVRILEKAIPSFQTEKIKKPDGDIGITIIRKLAHFVLYVVLGVLAVWTCRVFAVPWHPWLLALLFCVLYAGSDEIHQLFVPGRACRWYDVLLDSTGAGFGIFLFYFRHKSRKKSV